MKSGVTKSGRLPVLAGLVLALAACGGEQARPPVAVITPEPVRAILAQTGFQGFEPDVWVSLELVLSQKGVLDITVDWTFADTWMYAYLGRTNCTYDQLSNRNCPFLLSSETKDPKPRLLFTSSLDPGTYYLVLYNVPRNAAAGTGSNNRESVSIQLGLTVYPGAAQAPGAVQIGRTRIVDPRF